MVSIIHSNKWVDQSKNASLDPSLCQPMDPELIGEGQEYNMELKSQFSLTLLFYVSGSFIAYKVALKLLTFGI